MTFKLEQSQKQLQQLSMTQQLQLAIKMLQLNRMELQEMVTQEMKENPTLEEADGGDAVPDDIPAIDIDPYDGPGIDASEPLNFDAEHLEANMQKVVPEEGQGHEVEWEQFVESMSHGPSAGTNMAVRDDDDERPYDAKLTSSSSLQDYLIWQLHLLPFGDDELDAGYEIVGNINERGYLEAATLEDISESAGVPLDVVQRVHRKLLSLDPQGIGARSLEECLTAQAYHLGLSEHSVVVQIITGHLPLVAKGRTDTLSKKLGVSQEEIKEAIEIIRGLEPIPGRNFASEEPDTVEPDVYVDKIGDEYRIRTNEAGLPALRISNFYRSMLADKSKPQEAREYIKERLRSAAWLIRSIDQRHKTIHRVAQVIIREQRDFLERGMEYIRPMSLREVAEELEVHESTVSRATSNKYMSTPRGVCRLKGFFHTGVTTDQGDVVSPDLIKRRIRQLVDEEDKCKPLSDAAIGKLLEGEGVQLARRTVAKYRELAGIPARSVRRERS